MRGGERGKEEYERKVRENEEEREQIRWRKRK